MGLTTNLVKVLPYALLVATLIFGGKKVAQFTEKITNLSNGVNSEFSDLRGELERQRDVTEQLVHGINDYSANTADDYRLLDSNLREREIIVGEREARADTREKALDIRERNLEKRQEYLEVLRGGLTDAQLYSDELYRRYLDGELERDPYEYIEENFGAEDPDRWPSGDSNS